MKNQLKLTNTNVNMCVCVYICVRISQIGIKCGLGVVTSLYLLYSTSQYGLEFVLSIYNRQVVQ